VGSKRKRAGDDLSAEAAAAVKDFLAHFAALPLPELGAAGATAEVARLVSSLESAASTNPELARVLKAC
jgi:hypothetical protein